MHERPGEKDGTDYALASPMALTPLATLISTHLDNNIHTLRAHIMLAA
jgi:hypothetical protein